jgi:hypothetical protein
LGKADPQFWRKAWTSKLHLGATRYIAIDFSGHVCGVYTRITVAIRSVFGKCSLGDKLDTILGVKGVATIFPEYHWKGRDEVTFNARRGNIYVCLI